MSITLRDGFSGESLDRVLEDLLVRFVINCPDEDLSSIERVFFQIEEAQWFYQDFVRPINSSLPHLKMKGFSTLMIERCPMIWKWGSASEALAKFGKYKSTIPVRGAALLNSTLDKILLVKGTESNSWGFPRGKISKDEDDVLCAIREVKEETGFDCTDLIDGSNYLERTIQGKNFKIFFIDGVPENYNFQPEARNEISEIAWKDLKSLNKESKKNSHLFFLVSAMIKPIMSYVAMKKGKGNDEEIKRKIAIELKQLLGVTNSLDLLSGKVDIDPGRELLEQLKLARKVTPDTLFAPPIVQQQQQLIQQQQQPQTSNFPGVAQFPPIYPFQPFMPYLAGNGQPLPFSPNMIQPGQLLQIPPQFFMPPPTFNAHPQQNLGLMVPHPDHLRGPIPHQSYQISNAPTPESLHKPSFSLLNKRSTEADSKFLLGVLNKTPQVEPLNEILSPAAKEAANRSKSKFLVDLFDKNSNNTSTFNPEKRKLTLLKRDDNMDAPPTQPRKVSLLRRSPDANSDPKNDILSLLKKNDIKKEEIKKDQNNNNSNKKLENINGEKQPRNVSSNVPHNEILAMLNRSESHSRSVTPNELKTTIPKAEDSNHELEPIESELSDHFFDALSQNSISGKATHNFNNSFDDFEDFEELEKSNPSIVDHKNLLNYDYSDEDSDYSDEEILSESPSYEEETKEQKIEPINTSHLQVERDQINGPINNSPHLLEEDQLTNEENSRDVINKPVQAEPVRKKFIQILKRGDNPPVSNDKPQTMNGTSNRLEQKNEGSSILSLLKKLKPASESTKSLEPTNSNSILHLLHGNSKSTVDSVQPIAESLNIKSEDNINNKSIPPQNDLLALLNTGKSNMTKPSEVPQQQQQQQQQGQQQSSGQSASSSLLSLLKKPQIHESQQMNNNGFDDPAIVLTNGQHTTSTSAPPAQNYGKLFLSGLLNNNNSSNINDNMMPQKNYNDFMNANNRDINLMTTSSYPSVPPSTLYQLESNEPQLRNGLEDLLNLLRRK